MKYNLVWNDDETILEYYENTSYSWNEVKSDGLDPTNVTISTVNLPLIVRGGGGNCDYHNLSPSLSSSSPQGFLLQFEKLIKMAPSFPEPIKTIVIDLIRTIITELKVDFSEKLIMTRTVEEILWGYQDPFLKFVADLLANVTFIDLSNVLPPNGVFQLEVSSFR